MKFISIGSFTLKNPYFLAPMEEVNDIAFRLLCQKAGAGLVYTGMIHPQSHQEFSFDDKPALQLFCTTTKGIKEFIEKNDDNVVMWDFNLGCPAKTAKKHGFGSFLHHDIESIEEIIKTIRESTKKPVTIKIRKSSKALKIIKMAEKYCDAVCIHPRTQIQGYGGVPDVDFAKKVKDSVNIPVIYSGNIDENNAKEFLETFDFVMIARNAIGNPNIFAKLTNNDVKITFNDYLDLAKKYNLPFRQIKFQAMNFTKGMDNAKELRLGIFKAKRVSEIREIFNQ